ncbi:alanine:cation symporter family protein [Halanaerobaculum tunisiense]
MLIMLVGGGIVLGVKYREKNEEGQWVGGGPMYYIKKGLD